MVVFQQYNIIILCRKTSQGPRGNSCSYIIWRLYIYIYIIRVVSKLYCFRLKNVRTATKAESDEDYCSCGKKIGVENIKWFYARNRSLTHTHTHTRRYIPSRYLENTIKPPFRVRRLIGRYRSLSFGVMSAAHSLGMYKKRSVRAKKG